MNEDAAGRRSFWLLAPAVGFLLVFFVYPVVDMLSVAFIDSGGRFTLGNFARLFEHAVYFKVLRITFEIALLTTLLCLVLGYPVAYFLAHSNATLRGKLLLVVLMPFWTGFLVRTFSWMILLADAGPLTAIGHRLGLIELQLSNNLVGVLIGMSHALLPLAVLNMLAVMQSIDGNLMRVAATLGARPGEAFWRVYFPLSLPGVAAAALVVFITALGFFITPAVLGSPQQTMIAQVIIVQLQEVLNWRFAAVLSLVLLASSLIVYFVYDRFVGLSSIAGAGAGVVEPAGARAGRVVRTGPRLGIGIALLGALGRASSAVAHLRETSGRWLAAPTDSHAAVLRPAAAARGAGGERRLQAFVVGAILIFLVVPSFFVIPVSFTSSTFLDFPPRGFSWRWYGEFFRSPIWVSATLRSLYVAAAVAVLATTLGVCAALALSRREFRAKRWVMALVLAPMILPRMIIAVGLFYLLARVQLVGTDLALIIGHTVLAFPFVVVTVLAMLKNYDPQFDRAAMTLGATPLRTFFNVTLPLIKSGVVAAAIFAFMTSFDDLNLALFLAGGEQNTLPKQMWSTMILQANPLLGAASTMLLILMTAFAFAAEMLSRRGRTTAPRGKAVLETLEPASAR